MKIGAIVVLILTLGCGIAIGFGLSLVPRGPSMQSVIDFLDKPVQIPQTHREKLLKTMGGGGGTHSGGDIEWGETFVIDVTAVNPNDYAVIRNAYRDYFLKQFPMRGSVFSPNGGLEFGNPSTLLKWGEEFLVGAEPGWVMECGEWKPFRLVIRTQLIDFEPSSPGNFDRHVVDGVSFPRPNAQRVMWIGVIFEAKGLSGSGKWPEKPTSAPTTNVAS